MFKRFFDSLQGENYLDRQRFNEEREKLMRQMEIYKSEIATYQDDIRNLARKNFLIEKELTCLQLRVQVAEHQLKKAGLTPNAC